jgi:hypothetical protein
LIKYAYSGIVVFGYSTLILQPRYGASLTSFQIPVSFKIRDVSIGIKGDAIVIGFVFAKAYGFRCGLYQGDSVLRDELV